MKKNFKDYYSKQAEEYSKYRPDYPRELFEFLNSIISGNDLAVDVQPATEGCVRVVRIF
ncbi:MAG: hypothetical protein M3P82_06195 [Bacteroidota bacterium]|nr:hypothetical protein [Bacteroidota bacterium]